MSEIIFAVREDGADGGFDATALRDAGSHWLTARCGDAEVSTRRRWTALL
jgi:hypothetical protein